MSDADDLPDDELDIGLNAAFGPPRPDDAAPEEPATGDTSSTGPAESIRDLLGDRNAVKLDEDPATPAAESPTNAAGTPRYDVREEIARGGMGAIYRVRDRDLRRSLAMKVLLGGGPGKREPGAPTSTEHLNRFLEEAQITAQLSHTGVVPVHELGIDADGRVFFTMNLVRGKTLGEVIELARRNEAGWSTTRALQSIIRVCETVAFAHDKGVIHRDLKPANVMIGKFGDTYVMDWGLAKVMGREDRRDLRPQTLDPSELSRIESLRDGGGAAHDAPIMTMDGAVIGTPAYMSPEQAEGRVEEVDARSDVYAIGTLLYELLTGQPPYVASGARVSPHMVLTAVMMGPPKPVSELAPDAPEELHAICEKAMRRERGQRYASAEELSEDLHRFLSGHVVRAHKSGALIELKKWVGRNRGVAATSAAALVVLAGVTGYFLDSLARAERVASDRADEAEIARNATSAALRETELERNAKSEALREAERERDVKTEALRGARVLGLVVASAEAQGSNSMTSLLLARAAVRTKETKVAVARLRAALVPPHEQAILQGHEGAVLSATFSPDGLRIVTASRDKTVRVWDSKGGQLAVLDGHEGEVQSATFSPDGARILTASDDKTARIWDAEGRQVAVLPTPSADRTIRVRIGPAVARRSAGHMLSAAYSREGSHVVTASDDRTARLWNADGREIAVLRRHEGTVRSAALSPDGTRILTASDDKTARIWDVEGREIAVLRGHEGTVRSAAFSRDGTRILTASYDKTARIWDAEGREIAVLRGHTSGLLSAAFSSDGSRILTASFDNTARLWNARGREIAVLRGHDGPVRSAAFSPDGSRVVTASDDGTARIWEAEAREVSVLRGCSEYSAAFSPDGSRIVTTSLDKTARLWDARGQEIAVLRGHDGQVLSAAFSADSARIVTSARDGTARVWDAEGREVTVLRGHTTRSLSAAFSPDGSRIVTSEDRTARLWDAKGQEIAVLRGHEVDVRSAAFSPDGSHIVTASLDGTARLWDAEGREVTVLRGHKSGLLSAAFSSDGSRILTASFDNTARLWDAEGREITVLRGHDTPVRTAAFSPDGTRIVTASSDGPGPARLWDAEGREVAALRGHAGPVHWAAFSPDGSRIVTASFDNTARLWDAEGQEIAVLRGHEAAVWTASFSPDGSRVATTSLDGTARIWFVLAEDLLALADERCIRDFTPEERERYADLLGDDESRR